MWLTAMNCARPGNYRNQFQSPEVKPHILNMFRSRFRDSVTVDLSPGDDTTATKVESSAYPYSLFSTMEKSSLVRGRNNCPKDYPQALLTPPMLTSLLIQPSTATYCDRLKEKLCQSRQHRTSNSDKSELKEDLLMVYPIKSCTEVDLNYYIDFRPVIKALGVFPYRNWLLLKSLHSLQSGAHNRNLLSQQFFHSPHLYDLIVTAVDTVTTLIWSDYHRSRYSHYTYRNWLSPQSLLREKLIVSQQ